MTHREECSSYGVYGYYLVHSYLFFPSQTTTRDKEFSVGGEEICRVDKPVDGCCAKQEAHQTYQWRQPYSRKEAPHGDNCKENDC